MLGVLPHARLQDPTTRDWKRNRWLALGPEVTAQVKNMVLTALSSSVRAAGHTAAQVVGTIGALELPIKRWEELLPTLLKNVLQAPTDLVRISTLEVGMSIILTSSWPLSPRSSSNDY